MFENMFDNCIDEDRIKKLTLSELKMIEKIFSRAVYYCLSCNDRKTYGAILEKHFKTWRGAARAIYKIVREKQKKVVFCVWEIDKLTGSQKIIRRYTFK